MTKYIIKDNLPSDKRARHIETQCSLYKSEARDCFLKYANYLSDYYDIKVVFRNEKGKTLRGTIRVEIDGFYYYVELFKMK